MYANWKNVVSQKNLFNVSKTERGKGEGALPSVRIELEGLRILL